MTLKKQMELWCKYIFWIPDDCNVTLHAVLQKQGGEKWNLTIIRILWLSHRVWWRKTSFIWWGKNKTHPNTHTSAKKRTIKNRNSLALQVVFVSAVKQNAFASLAPLCPLAWHEHLTLTSGQQNMTAPVGARPLSAPCASSNYRTKHSNFFFFFFFHLALCVRVHERV